ncbi:MAG TPA: cation:proton antiporter [Bacteroidetes bacterium]|nr:cation:proton antiporter [Bacteroidota bacterium]
MEIKSIFVIFFVLVGIFFMLIGSIGILRLPDFFSRTHAISKSDTLGILFVVLGLIIHDGTLVNSLKLGLIMIFIALANPIGSHALANAALKKGMKPLLHKKKKEN